MCKVIARMSTVPSPEDVDWISPDVRQWPAHAKALTTVRYLAAAGAGAPAGVSVGPYSGFNLADHVGDEAAAVAANRAWLQQATGVGAIQWLSQVHGNRCIQASPDSVKQLPQADAAWTSSPGVAVAILTADCVPVVIADRDCRAVGIAHGGWRGLVGGVIGNLVRSLPVPPRRLCAWIGPAIGAQAYEVGEDVVEAVRGVDVAVASACVGAGQRPGKYQLDLFALTGMLLQRAGVSAVPGARLCTYSDPRFYSYRRDGTTGRMATLAWLSESGGSRGRSRVVAGGIAGEPIVVEVEAGGSRTG
jgi:polyphenol oxidase